MKHMISQATATVASPDAKGLFLYLKLLPHVPSHVHFTVELKSATSVTGELMNQLSCWKFLTY
jgi:hypothetical protein